MDAMTDDTAEAEAQLASAIAERATMFVELATGEGAPLPPEALDFSSDSLDVVDEILETFHAQGGDLPEPLLWMVSSYVLEVARREYGGRYFSGPESDPVVLVMGEPVVQVGIMVFGKVRGRVTNGEADSITFFYDGIEAAIARGVNATIV